MTLLTSTGYQGTSFSDRRLRIVQYVRQANSAFAKLDFGADTPEGQLIDALIEEITDIDEAGEAAYNATDPQKATSATALAIARLRGVSPRPARSGTVTATCNLDAGTYAAGSLIAYVSGEPDNRWVSDVDIVSTSTDDYGVGMSAEAPGSGYTAPAGTLTERIGVTGWNSVTNAADAVPGVDADTPEQTLFRSESMFYRTASDKLTAMRAALLGVDGVVDALVVNGSGSVRPVIWDAESEDADNGEVAAAIWSKLPSGIGTTGAIADTSTGFGVNFDRAAVLRIYADINVSAVGVDAATIKSALQDAMPSVLGGRVVWAQLMSSVLAIPGVADVVDLGLDVTASPTATDNIQANSDEYPDLDTSDIEVAFS